MGSNVSTGKVHNMKTNGGIHRNRRSSRLMHGNIISISNGVVMVTSIDDFPKWTAGINKTADKYQDTSATNNNNGQPFDENCNISIMDGDPTVDGADSSHDHADDFNGVDNAGCKSPLMTSHRFPVQHTTLGLREQRQRSLLSSSDDFLCVNNSGRGLNRDLLDASHGDKPRAFPVIVKTSFAPSRLFFPLRSRIEGQELDSLSLGDMSIRRVQDACTMSISALYGDKIMCALPLYYTLTSCGGQSGPIRSLSCNGDGSQFTVAVVGSKQCYVVCGEEGKVSAVIKGHYDPVLCCAQSPDSKFLVTTSADCTAILWDINNGKRLREIAINFQANLCVVSDCSDLLATTSTEDIVQVWDAKTCELIYTFTSHGGPIYALTFCRRGEYMASAGANGELYVWHHATGEIRRSFPKHKTPVLSVSFSHDGKRLCSLDRECLKMWDVFTGTCVFSRSNRGVISMGPNAATENIKEEMPMSEREGTVECLRFLSVSIIACNLVIVSLSSKTLLILEPNSGHEVLSIHTKAIVTAFHASFCGDVIVLGDMHGNQYRLKLFFSPRDVRLFNLNSKAISNDKVRILCD